MTDNGKPEPNLPAPLNPWDRQPGETDKQFQAFSVYRDLDPSARSIRRTAEILGKAEPTLNPWSQANRWVERAGAYDAYLDAQQREQREKDRLAMLRRQGALGAALQTPAFIALRGDESEGIKPTIDPTKLTPLDVARLADVGARIEREASGMAEGRRGQYVNPSEMRAIVGALLDIGFDVIGMCAVDAESSERWSAEYFRRFDEFLNGGGWRSGGA